MDWNFIDLKLFMKKDKIGFPYRQRDWAKKVSNEFCSRWKISLFSAPFLFSIFFCFHFPAQISRDSFSVIVCVRIIQATTIRRNACQIKQRKSKNVYPPINKDFKWTKTNRVREWRKTSWTKAQTTEFEANTITKARFYMSRFFFPLKQRQNINGKSIKWIMWKAETKQKTERYVCEMVGIKVHQIETSSIYQTVAHSMWTVWLVFSLPPFE